MATPTQAWLNEASGRNQDAVFLAIISLDTGDLKLVDKSLPRLQFDALPVLDSPQPLGVKIEPFSGKSTVSQQKLRIIDKGQFFSQLVSSQFLRNRIVTFKVGFANVDESDFLTDFVGKIKDWTSPSPGRWELTVEDSLGDLSEKVPKASGTKRVDTAFWNDPQIPAYVVASAQDSPPAIFTDIQSFDSTHVEDRTLAVRFSADTIRLYQVSSISAGGGFTTWNVQTGTPLADGIANSFGADLLGDNVVDVMLNILKRVNMPDSQIQVATFFATRDTFLPTIRVRRITGKPVKALDLIQELAEVGLMSFFPDGENRLAVKFFGPPAPHDDVYELDENKMQDVDNVKQDPDNKLMANRIVIFGNHDSSQFENPENFGRIDIFVDADSQENQLDVETREVKSQWLHSSVTDLTWYNVIGGKLLKRLVQPPRRLKTNAPLDIARTTVADMISVTNSALAGQPTGVNTVGVTQELWQLIEKRPNVVDGGVDVEMLDARLDKFAGWISHSFQPDYDLASGLDRRHAYIGTATFNKVGSSQDDGYYIQ